MDDDDVDAMHQDMLEASDYRRIELITGSRKRRSWTAREKAAIVAASAETCTEALDVVPAIVRVKKTIRPKYACRACENTVVQATALARMTTGGMATTALVAQVVVWKYGWHLPLHRQSQMFAAQGVRLDRGTLGLWAKRAAWWLKPVYERLLGFIRSQPKAFCDETRLPRLDPGRGRTKICQLWGQHSVL